MLNKLWQTYGCDKCDNYQLLVIDNHVQKKETKEEFKSYIAKYSTKYPCIYVTDGGEKICTALDNKYGGVKFFIKPDKTYIGNGSNINSIKEADFDAEIKNAGIKPHKCSNTSIEQNISVIPKPTLFIPTLSKNTLCITFLVQGDYQITLFSLKGEIKKQIPVKNYSKGNSYVLLSDAKLTNGINIVSIRDKNNVTYNATVVMKR